MDFALHVCVMIGIYAVLAYSLDLVVGHGGLLSIAHAGFYGLGGYAAALVALRLGWPLPAELVAAAAVAGVAGLLVGAPSLRLKGDHFAIATFALQIILYQVLNNWNALTGGPLGLPGIPRPGLFGWEVTTMAGHMAFVVVVAALSIGLLQLVVRSPFGRVLRAIREDEVLVASLGKPVARFKLAACVLSAAMAGLAGALFAHYISYIDPSSFTVMESIFIISIVIIGGAGTLWGPIVGAVLLIALPELLRFIGLPAPFAANLRQVFYGLLLVLFMLWRPQGIMGGRADLLSRRTDR